METIGPILMLAALLAAVAALLWPVWREVRESMRVSALTPEEREAEAEAAEAELASLGGVAVEIALAVERAKAKAKPDA